jgi:tetratricopeptide (TPR) repeat protein
MKWIPALCLSLFLTHCASAPLLKGVPKGVTGPEGQASAVEADALGEAAMKDLLTRGYERYKKSDFAGAIQLWEMVWLLNRSKKQDPWTPALLSYCYLATGQYSKAVSLAEERLKRDPHSTLPYHQLGVALLWSGKTAEAESTLRLAAEFESRSADTFFYLGIALERLGKLPEAEKEWERGESEYNSVLRSNPTDFVANYGLAQLLLYRRVKLEEAEKAIQTAKTALGTSTDSELALERELYMGFYLPALEGQWNLQRESPSTAVAPLLLALKNSPSGAKADIAEIYFHLGQALSDLKQPETSKDFFAKARELDPFGMYSKTSAASKREGRAKR